MAGVLRHLFPRRAVGAALGKAAQAHRGFFVGMAIPEPAATALALPGGEAAGELHITLAYCPRWDETMAGVAIAAVEAVTAGWPPLVGSVGTLGRFPASEQSDGKDVVYAQVLVDGLERLRAEVAGALLAVGLQPARSLAYVPHVTLAYVAPGAPAPSPGRPIVNVRLASVTIKAGTVVPVVVPLGGAGPLVKAAGRRRMTLRTLTPQQRRLVAASNRTAPAMGMAEAALRERLAMLFRREGPRIATALSKRLGLEKADVPDDVDQAVRDLDLTGWSVLVDPTAEALGAVTAAGARRALEALKVDVDVWEIVNQGALDFARERAAEMVGMRVAEDGSLVENPDPKWAITEGTRDLIRDDVARMFEEGVSRDEFQRQLVDSYAFSEARAETVARTEIIRAQESGAMVAWQASGEVVGSTWVLSDLHDIDDVCDENAAAGMVPLGEEFPSGDTEPGAHPRCECSLFPVLRGEEADEE